MKVLQCGSLHSEPNAVVLRGWLFDAGNRMPTQRDALRAALAHIAEHHGIELAEQPETLTLEAEREALIDIAAIRGKGKSMDQHDDYLQSTAWPRVGDDAEPHEERGPMAMLGVATLAFVFLIGAAAGWLAAVMR